MATRNRALIAAKRSLDRQSWGGRKGRFAVQRTLEHLKQCTVVLNDDVRAIKLNLRPPESKNQGAKRFFFENVPQLRYHNPNLEVTRTSDRVGDAALQICFADGREEKILTQEKTNLQILNELARLASNNRIPSSGDNVESPKARSGEAAVTKSDSTEPIGDSISTNSSES